MQLIIHQPFLALHIWHYNTQTKLCVTRTQRGPPKISFLSLRHFILWLFKICLAKWINSKCWTAVVLDVCNSHKKPAEDTGVSILFFIHIRRTKHFLKSFLFSFMASCSNIHSFHIVDKIKYSWIQTHTRGCTHNIKDVPHVKQRSTLIFSDKYVPFKYAQFKHTVLWKGFKSLWKKILLHDGAFKM